MQEVEQVLMSGDHKVLCGLAQEPQVSRGVGGPGTAPGAGSGDTALDTQDHQTTGTSGWTSYRATTRAAS